GRHPERLAPEAGGGAGVSGLAVDDEPGEAAPMHEGIVPPRPPRYLVTPKWMSGNPSRPDGSTRSASMTATTSPNGTSGSALKPACVSSANCGSCARRNAAQARSPARSSPPGPRGKVTPGPGPAQPGATLPLEVFTERPPGATTTARFSARTPGRPRRSRMRGGVVTMAPKP